MLTSDHKGQAGATVGIGVTTYNRLPLLKAFVEAVRANTRAAWDLVIADDGSTDGTQEWCADEGLSMVGGTHKGIAGNKNRCLYTLMRHSMAGVLILFDDDCYPVLEGWDEVWVAAAERWGHVNALHPRTAAAVRAGQEVDDIMGGLGTAEAPYECKRISGICIASSRPALCRVGFFDARFGEYGHEHSEWTLRFHRLGYGRSRRELNGVETNINLMLEHGLGFSDVKSVSDKSSVHHHRALMDELKREGTYRLPWRTPKERMQLLKEVSAGVRRRPVGGVQEPGRERVEPGVRVASAEG
jgi:GT2 family glycosyltransferase